MHRTNIYIYLLVNIHFQDTKILNILLLPQVRELGAKIIRLLALGYKGLSLSFLNPQLHSTEQNSTNKISDVFYVYINFCTYM